MNLKSNAMSSSPEVIAKQTGTVENSASQGILRYININKRKIIPQKVYNLKNNRFALLDNENYTENQNGTPNSAPKPPPIFLREASSSVIVKILTELVGNNNFHIISNQIILIAKPAKDLTLPY